ncbi:nucleotide cyclase [Baffinella frigidus]|nr:nucleotide cyclase [Cryptophyta sp. CCMP2293]
MHGCRRIHSKPETQNPYPQAPHQVLFTDVVAFTAMSAQCHSSQVCDLLDELFSVFDTISTHFDVYRFETVGDAYMIAGGLFDEGDECSARATCEAVSAFLLERVLFRHAYTHALLLLIRAGLHVGPLMSGVVGLRMPHFTVFGDTVNMASRMESNGEPGRVQVSGDIARVLATR